MLAALLAAAMSTIDSVLLVASAAFQRDVLPAFGVKGGQDVRSARRIVVIYALLPLALAAVARGVPSMGAGIVELSVFAGALYAAAFLPPLVGVLYWGRGTGRGAVVGMVAGAAATILWKIGAGGGVPEVFVGIAFGTIGFITGSLATRKRSLKST